MQLDLLSVLVRIHATDPQPLSFLGNALFNMASSTYPLMEVVIITQQFSAEQIAKVRSLADQFQWAPGACVRIQNYESPVSGDHRSALLNRGIDFASGQYIAILDYDDYVFEHAYQALIGQLNRGTSAIAFGGCREVYSTKTASGFYVRSKATPYFDKEPACFYEENIHPIHSFVIDRRKLPHVPRFNEAMSRVEDYHWLLQLRKLSTFDTALLPTILCEYVLRNDGSNSVLGHESSRTPENLAAWEQSTAILNSLRFSEDLRWLKKHPDLVLADRQSSGREYPSANDSRNPATGTIGGQYTGRSEAVKRSAKIVGLVPARNEGQRIAFCLRALARFADAIVYLDDCSDDDTLAIVESLAGECRVERILRKSIWHRDEPGDRNALLQAGREIGGTHFMMLDADEAFTANFEHNEYLRKLVLALEPGDRITMNWIQLWRSTAQYRFDSSVWTWNARPCIFCDDGKSLYYSEFIHTARLPNELRGRDYLIDGYTFGVLHFQFVNWRNLLVKQAWYRCLERIREPRKPAAEINARYAPSKDETNLGLRGVLAEWFCGYDFFDPEVFNAPYHWREAQILQWFEEFGGGYFSDLDIWDLNLEASGE